eukprot:COSAG01_NODE_23783_length_802_cov_0.812233_1_plen_73_part_10
MPERTDDSIVGLDQRIFVPGSTVLCWAVQVRLCLRRVPGRALSVVELAHQHELHGMPERTDDSSIGLDQGIFV